MSKANAKATNTPAQEAPSPASNTAADGGATTVVQPAQATGSIAPPDPHHGQGGHYVVIGGERRLFNRAKQPT